MAFTKQTRETGAWLDGEAIKVLHFVQGRTANAPEHVRREIPQPSSVNLAILERAAWFCGVDGQKKLVRMRHRSTQRRPRQSLALLVEAAFAGRMC